MRSEISQYLHTTADMFHKKIHERRGKLFMTSYTHVTDNIELLRHANEKGWYFWQKGLKIFKIDVEIERLHHRALMLGKVEASTLFESFQLELNSAICELEQDADPTKALQE